MNRSFFIGDASRETAFITNPDGYDVVTLFRVLTPGENSISDSDWQLIIDKIDEAMKTIVRDSKED